MHVETATKAVETDKQPNMDVPVRIKSSRSESATLIQPRCLKAVSQLMSENMSASEAIKAVHIVDTKIWGQTRHLPPELAKQYTKSLSKLKKLQGQANVTLNSILEVSSDSVAPDSTDSIEMTLDTNEQQLETTATVIDTQANAEIDRLKSIIEAKIEIRRKDPTNTLPVPASVRRNHSLMAVYCEALSANELI